MTTAPEEEVRRRQVWFITGASTGLGLAVTQHVLAQGHIAVATARQPSKLAALQAEHPALQLLILPLDVTHPAQIGAAFQQAVDAFGHVDVVYNNAGTAFRAEVEGTPDTDARALFEVNFWGAVGVMREAVKVFREVNRPERGGRLLMVSSMAGVDPFPLTGFYSTTKFAIEGISHTLAKELDPAWNIKLTILEPGAFNTRAATSDSAPRPPHPAYMSPTSPIRFVREVIDTPGHPLLPQFDDPARCARAIWRVAQEEKPPLRLAIGRDAVARIRTKLETQLEELRTYEAWSDEM